MKLLGLPQSSCSRRSGTPSPARGVVTAFAAKPLPARRRSARQPGSGGAILTTDSSTVQSINYSTIQQAFPTHDPVSLADFGARVTLERLYQLSDGASGDKSGCSWGSLAPTVLQVTLDEKPQQTRNQERSPDYFANVGDAIRTLREDIPDLFNHELNYSIYRDDIVFKDPRNKFTGIKNYKLIFWSLRFHGRIFFTKLFVEVKRIWQPTDDVIKMRWTVHGIPRVPWEAEGLFDGISTYKLDNHGRVYEHCVDNVLLRDPPMLTNPPLLAGLNLVPGTPQAPIPGAWGSVNEDQGSLVLAAVPNHDANSTAHSSHAVLQPSQPPVLCAAVQAAGTVPCQAAASSVASSAYLGQGQQSTSEQEHSSTDSSAGRDGSSTAPVNFSNWVAALLPRFSWVRLYTAVAFVQVLAGFSEHHVQLQQQQ